MENKTEIKSYGSIKEKTSQDSFTEHFRNCPIPDNQILSNLGLFLNSKNLSRILFMNHLYKQNVDVQGVVMEFGTRWGQNSALFSALRGIYEPFNRHRKIISFDTFEGFPSIDEKDGKSEMMVEGGLELTKDYQNYLNEIMRLQEAANPLAHIKKYELVQGDAMNTVKNYFEKHPETIVSLAYFDFDLYKPTKKVLEIIKPRLVKGSVVGFDELNDSDSPGETLALQEVFGLNNIKLKRFPHASRVSYFIV